MEVPRREGAEDVMRWYCRDEACGKREGGLQVVWEKRFVCEDLGTQIKQVVEEFASDEEKRRCKRCGNLVEVRFKEGEVVQPARFPE